MDNKTLLDEGGAFFESFGGGELPDNSHICHDMETILDVIKRSVPSDDIIYRPINNNMNLEKQYSKTSAATTGNNLHQNIKIHETSRLDAMM